MHFEEQIGRKPPKVETVKISDGLLISDFFVGLDFLAISTLRRHNFNNNR